MASDAEIEAARQKIAEYTRAFWEAEPEAAEEMLDGYRAMARAALEAAERVRAGVLRAKFTVITT